MARQCCSSPHRMDWLWKEYFMNPCLWYNNLSNKNSIKSPDFKHGITSQCLWIDGFCNPSWVEEELSRRRTARGTKTINMLASHTGVVNDDDKEDLTIVSMLRACTKNKDLCRGMRIHDEIVEKGLLKKNPYIDCSLVSMYAKCGMLEKAQKLHDELNVRTVISWNALISGFAQHGYGNEALSCFEHMQKEGFSPNPVTFVCALRACGSIGSIKKGEEIHNEIVNIGMVLQQNVVVCTALVGMYVKCGALEKAEKLHTELCFRDRVSWNVLIGGYAQHERGEEALDCFERMQSEGFSPNEVTFVCILKACCSTCAIEYGRNIHNEIVAKGFLERNIVLGNALVDMYAKCDALVNAKQVHGKLYMRDIVSWSSLITGYVQQRQYKEALECFENLQSEDVSANEITFVSVLKACGSIGAINKGREIHDEISRRGFLKKSDELGNALVDMYAKCGVLSKAQEVLEQLRARSIVSWSSLIAGYAQHGRGQEALNCFDLMKKEGLSPDVVTFMAVLKACANIGAIDKGKQIHDEIATLGLLNKDVVLGTALVDMYAQCGVFSQARKVLNELADRNIVTWNALIAGYAQQGQVDEAFECFECMQDEGLSPDAITFLCLMNACSHSGLFDRAENYFHDMRDKYGIMPNLEHYTCLVSIFGFGGNFGKAISVIKMMPFSDCHPVWLALLGGCRKWRYVKLGRLAFDQLMHLDNTCSAAYVLMANIYADAAMEEAVEEVEAMRLRYCVSRNPEVNPWVDASGYVHSFSID